MARPIKLLSEREKLLLESAQKLTYREVEGGKDLSIYFYLPKDLKEKIDRPVLLFFNSGGWDRGSVIQFAPHALYYVERGAVCGLVEYRNKASHPDSSALESIQDGLLAIRFTRHYSEKLCLDPSKVIAVGAGAGGNIAGAATMKAHIPGEESEFNLSSSQPDAAVLISAIIDPEKGSYGREQFSSSGAARRASLFRYISNSNPPILMIHGTADRLVPFEMVSSFSEKMARKKGRFELVEFEGRDQNFFNYNTDPASYEVALSHIDRFLDHHGLLERIDDDDDDDGPRLISWRESDY
ncbi:MAG: alpha/beta hydrolase fold domain-containing protein [Verrucomicrobiota bacterium]